MSQRDLRRVARAVVVVVLGGLSPGCGRVTPADIIDGGGAGAGGTAGAGGHAGSGGAAGTGDRDGSTADGDGPGGRGGGSGSGSAGTAGAGRGGGDGGSSGGVGGAGSSGGTAAAGRGGASGGAGSGGARCTGSGVSAGCSDGFNCAAGNCVPATVSCAAHKSSHPSSGDGVYWIGPPARRAYCDMRVPIELCTELTEEHSGGRTRDGSNLTFALTSVLLWSQGECAIWALRALPDGIPFGPFKRPHPLTSCQAIGFLADGLLGSCAYGDTPGFSACGFGAPPLYQMGDDCAGCVVNDGPQERYTRQGPMHESWVLTSFDPQYADPLQGEMTGGMMPSSRCWRRGVARSVRERL
jgi:hypothetical protein